MSSIIHSLIQIITDFVKQLFSILNLLDFPVNERKEIVFSFAKIFDVHLLFEQLQVCSKIVTMTTHLIFFLEYI